MMIADCLRALMASGSKRELPIGPRRCLVFNGCPEAQDTLRKHAPCEACKGAGVFYEECDESFKATCRRCSGEGWTPASVEAAIAREESQRSVQHDSRCIAANGGMAPPVQDDCACRHTGKM